MERTEGASPACMSELPRRAVLPAAEDGRAGVVTGTRLEPAIAELAVAAGSRSGCRAPERMPGRPGRRLDHPASQCRVCRAWPDGHRAGGVAPRWQGIVSAQAGSPYHPSGALRTLRE